MKIYLDPGHGGRDPGTSGNGLLEKDIALSIGLATRNILQKEYVGADIRLSRTTDILAGGDHLSTGQSLSWRANDANEWGADLFVSIHCNGGIANGFESFRYNGISSPTKLQKVVHREIMDQLPNWVNDRGMKSANFAVLRDTKMQAVLTENLFLGHKDSADWLKSNWPKLARGHAEALAILGGLKKKDKEDDMPTAEEVAKAVWRMKMQKPHAAKGVLWQMNSLLKWAYGHSLTAVRQGVVNEAKLDALITALTEHDEGLQERLNQALQDATLTVDVNVNTFEEEPEEEPTQ